jgi:drug/metabolite transporter (DMT)-like permease
MSGAPGAEPGWTRTVPVLFVLIWSTGFIVARLGMPHAGPFGFLAWRFLLSALAFAVWIRLTGARWPQGRAQWAHLAVVGLLMQAGYLGGVWAAVKGGMSAGMAALIVGLQPLLTAVWVSRTAGRGEVSGRQWGGLALGLAGVLMVVWHKLGVREASLPTLAMTTVSLLCITCGALYQKRHVRSGDPRTAMAIQMGAALLVMLPLAVLEDEPVRWTGELLVALAWSVLALSLGASSLLVLLIQRGAATRVASLMYLVPPTTAVMAWLIFGEALTTGIVLGMAVCAVGVALVVREPVRSPGVPP